MDKSIIRSQFLSELSESSDHTRQVRKYYCDKFLDFAGDKPFSEWNKSLVNAFLTQLRAEGYSPGTVRLWYGVVKRVFDAARAVHESERARLISEVNPADPAAVASVLQAMSLPGPNWDFGKRSAPRVEAQDVVKPASTLEQLSAMVAAAKKGVLSVPERAYLAVSSIYGLRREELSLIRPEHIDWGKQTIFVTTSKGGERRNQLLCEEIIPYLAEYRFPEVLTLFQMSAMYQRIAFKAGVELPYLSGWHSPRRFLDTALRDLCGELETKIFLRWRISASSEMVERYYSRDPLLIDAQVLAVHPVVALWKEN